MHTIVYQSIIEQPNAMFNGYQLAKLIDIAIFFAEL